MGKLIALAAAGSFQPPTLLSAGHNTAAFDCGEPDLDAWLQRKAIKNQSSRASRTFVVCRGPDVIGFYSLAVGSVNHGAAPRGLRRNMPDPIPVMVLGRLAVQRTCQGHGIGPGLLKDAILRTVKVSEDAGMAALLVHAKHARAAEFYRKWDFEQSPIHELTYMMSVKQMIAVCGAALASIAPP